MENSQKTWLNECLDNLNDSIIAISSELFVMGAKSGSQSMLTENLSKEEKELLTLYRLCNQGQKADILSNAEYNASLCAESIIISLNITNDGHTIKASY